MYQTTPVCLPSVSDYAHLFPIVSHYTCLSSQCIRLHPFTFPMCQTTSICFLNALNYTNLFSQCVKLHPFVFSMCETTHICSQSVKYTPFFISMCQTTPICFLNVPNYTCFLNVLKYKHVFSQCVKLHPFVFSMCHTPLFYQCITSVCFLNISHSFVFQCITSVYFLSVSEYTRFFFIIYQTAHVCFNNEPGFIYLLLQCVILHGVSA